MSDVRLSRCDGDEDDVISGVSVKSLRWMESVGCCDGRFAMTSAGPQGEDVAVRGRAKRTSSGSQDI